MEYNRKTIRTLYKKLLTFYPPAFREQFSESMGQTFNDFCRENKTRGDGQVLSYGYSLKQPQGSWGNIYG